MFRWFEVATVYWDRRVTLAALQRLDDRALMDIGMPRSSIDYTVDRAIRSRLRRLSRG